MQNVMRKAWEIAREGQKKFGGKVRDYFAEALRVAWRIVKEMGKATDRLKDIVKEATGREWKKYGKHRVYIDASIKVIDQKNVNGNVVGIARSIEGSWYYDVPTGEMYRQSYRERDLTWADPEIQEFLRNEIKKMIWDKVREINPKMEEMAE
jgi:hypothetical protein